MGRKLTQTVAALGVIALFVAAYLIFTDDGPYEPSDDEPRWQRSQDAIEGRQMDEAVIKRQQQRLDHLSRQCATLDLKEYSLKFMYTRLLVSDDLQTIYCSLPKVGCTTWKRALGIASGHVTDADISQDTGDHSHFIRNPSSHVHTNAYLEEAGIRLLNSYSTAEQEYRLKNYFKFLFVRDPFERLRSAYEDKIGPRGVHFYQEDLSKSIDVPIKNLTLEIFLDTYSKMALEEGTRLNVHWRPFHLMCFPCHIHYDFIGNMETIYEDADYILQQAWKTKWTSQDLFIQSKGPNTHRDNLTAEDKLSRAYRTVSRPVLERVRQAFQPDFSLFAYNPFHML